MLKLDMLDSVTQVSYLSADKHRIYRVIMRIFFEEYQSLRYQLDKTALLARLRQWRELSQYSAEQLEADLRQLVEWRSLEAMQDPQKVHTISEYKNKQYQYSMSDIAVEVERMMMTIEGMADASASLSSNLSRRIYSALRDLEDVDSLELSEVGAWWQALQDDFRRLCQSYQDYLRDFNASRADKIIRSSAFLAYKHHFISYLEDFIAELQSHSAQIERRLKLFTSQQLARLFSRITEAELAIPRPQAGEPEARGERMRAQLEEKWAALLDWFVGEASTCKKALAVSNEIIRRIVQSAALIVQVQNVGISRKNEYRHFIKLFARCPSLPEAHRLSAYAFGAQGCRHFSGAAPRETDRIISVYETQPYVHPLRPKSRTQQARGDKRGFADKSAQKAAARKQLIEAQRALREAAMAPVRDGVLDFSRMEAPVSQAVRTLYLEWIAAAGMSDEGRGMTEYGQRYRLEKTGGICRLVCDDGVLEMPACRLVFEEALAHG